MLLQGEDKRHALAGENRLFGVQSRNAAMMYRLLGRSGLRVSELCLGTMTFGPEWGWGSDPAESRRVFDTFAEAGGNFLDTANRYTEGSSERLLGEFIAHDRHHFVLATKYTLRDRMGDPNFGGNHRKNMMRSVEESLKRLREHNQVSLVYYMCSRNVFRMTKKDLTICEYIVTGLARNRLDMDDHDQDKLLRNQFHNAISAAMSSLDSADGTVDREGSDDPVDQGES
jgi:hypothetical protein